ncbi:MAG: hypothetical protein KDK39_03500, partial [Leptospiraceae bacterium]|nr:hypothetical protein [Leptospiraceae bacterium]
MQIKNKVAMMEQYRAMLEQFRYQIETQNQKVATQTRSAALSAGWVEQGDLFIKKLNGVATAGVANKYAWFDTDYWIEKTLGEMDNGKRTMSDEQMITMLTEESEVEVDAFFESQKLAMKVVFEKIMGRAQNETQRKAGMRSQDKEAIGLFAHWVGQANNADETHTDEYVRNQITGEAQKLAQQYSGGLQQAGGALANILAYTANGGFGELGSGGPRPGGAPLGFYLQLKVFGDLIDQDQAMSGLTQSMYKGKSAMQKEYTARTAVNIGNAAKTAISIVNPLAGMAVGYVADSVQINPVTGKVVMHNSDKAMMNFAGPIASAGAKYDANGNMTNWSLGAGEREAFLMRQASSLIPVVGGLLAEHAIDRMNYKNAQGDTSLIGGLNSLASGLASYARQLEAEGNPKINGNMPSFSDKPLERMWAEVKDSYNDAKNDLANQLGSNNQALNALLGGVLTLKELDNKIAGSITGEIASLAKSVQAGLGNIPKWFGAESVGNWIQGNGYVTNETAQANFKKALAAASSKAERDRLMEQAQRTGIFGSSNAWEDIQDGAGLLLGKLGNTLGFVSDVTGLTNGVSWLAAKVLEYGAPPMSHEQMAKAIIAHQEDPGRLKQTRHFSTDESFDSILAYLEKIAADDQVWTKYARHFFDDPGDVLDLISLANKFTKDAILDKVLAVTSMYLDTEAATKTRLKAESMVDVFHQGEYADLAQSELSKNSIALIELEKELNAVNHRLDEFEEGSKEYSTRKEQQFVLESTIKTLLKANAHLGMVIKYKDNFNLRKNEMTAYLNIAYGEGEITVQDARFESNKSNYKKTLEMELQKASDVDLAMMVYYNDSWFANILDAGLAMTAIPFPDELYKSFSGLDEKKLVYGLHPKSKQWIFAYKYRL